MSAEHRGGLRGDAGDRRISARRPMTRVAVLGGGPAGASAALALARGGVEVDLYLPARPGEKPCGGAVPEHVLPRIAGFDPSPLPAVVAPEALLEDARGHRLASRSRRRPHLPAAGFRRARWSRRRWPPGLSRGRSRPSGWRRIQDGVRVTAGGETRDLRLGRRRGRRPRAVAALARPRSPRRQRRPRRLAHRARLEPPRPRLPRAGGCLSLDLSASGRRLGRHRLHAGASQRGRRPRRARRLPRPPPARRLARPSRTALPLSDPRLSAPGRWRPCAGDSRAGSF